MKIATISDIHITKNHDQGSQLFESFTDRVIQERVDQVVLLGDIFDLMVGPKNQYLNQFSQTFQNIKKIEAHGIKVSYIEGNHDFHLKGLFTTIKLEGPLKVIKDNNKVIILVHGDDLEIDNLNYIKYKNIITAPFFYFLARFIVPYQGIRFIGEYASHKSKQYHDEINDENFVKLRDKYRGYADLFYQNQGHFDLLIAGHSHIIDHYTSDQYEYLNNGYPLVSRKFVLIDDGNAQLISL